MNGDEVTWKASKAWEYSASLRRKLDNWQATMILCKATQEVIACPWEKIKKHHGRSMKCVQCRQWCRQAMFDTLSAEVSCAGESEMWSVWAAVAGCGWWEWCNWSLPVWRGGSGGKQEDLL